MAVKVDDHDPETLTDEPQTLAFVLLVSKRLTKVEA